MGLSAGFRIGGEPVGAEGRERAGHNPSDIFLIQREMNLGGISLNFQQEIEECLKRLVGPVFLDDYLLDGFAFIAFMRWT